MEIEFNKLESVNTNIIKQHGVDGQKCVFYKEHVCNPNKANFKICMKCHRSKVFTMEKAVFNMYQRIIGMAILMMNTMGINLSSSGSGTDTGASSGGSASGGSSGGGAGAA